MEVIVIEIKPYQLKNIMIKLNDQTLKLKGTINNIKKSDTWTIQLTIAINFISSLKTLLQSVQERS